MIAVREDTVDGLLTRLRSGDIDFAVSFLPDKPLAAPLAADTLLDDGIVAVVRCGHPLEGAQGLSHAALIDYSLVLPPQPSFVRSMIDSFWQRHGIALQTGLAPDLPAAWGDRVQIQQVIANLLLNAIEAMAQPGITRRALQVTSTRQADRLLVYVIDSGAGIAASQQAQVFDAFWTDKPGGIGLGLSISRAIIEAHGGHIEVQAAPHGGALFHFSVPIAPTVPAKETA